MIRFLNVWYYVPARIALRLTREHSFNTGVFTIIVFCWMWNLLVMTAFALLVVGLL